MPNIDSASIALELIYAAYVSGTKASTTGIQSGGNDLSNLFAPLSAGSANLSPMHITAGGVSLNAIFAGIGTLFTPFIDTFSTAGAVTITIPTNASSAFIEVWGASGGGGAGSTTSGTPHSGGGAGSGGYCATSISVSGHSSQTLTANVGTAGANGSPGTASNVATGSFSITTMIAGGSNAGGNATTVDGSPGVGGTASGGSTTNTSGNSGGPGPSGGLGISGTNGTGATGGNGGTGSGQSNRTPGGNGLIKVSWT